MPGYASRMRSDAVSRHILPRVPEPEGAEFESQVFSVTYTNASHESRTSFSVLALDTEHADALGRLRLRAQGEPHPEAAILLERVAFGFDYDRVSAVLSYESEAEREHRRQAYRARVSS